MQTYAHINEYALLTGSLWFHSKKLPNYELSKYIVLYRVKKIKNKSKYIVSTYCFVYNFHCSWGQDQWIVIRTKINLWDWRNPRLASRVVCFKLLAPLPLPLPRPLPLVEVLLLSDSKAPRDDLEAADDHFRPLVADFVSDICVVSSSSLKEIAVPTPAAVLLLISYTK